MFLTIKVYQKFQKNPDCPCCREELDSFHHNWIALWKYHKGQDFEQTGNPFEN